jgi:hypothetical protein
MGYNWQTGQWDESTSSGGFQQAPDASPAAAPEVPSAPSSGGVPNTSAAIMGNPQIQGLVKNYGLNGQRADALSAYMKSMQGAQGKAPDEGFDWQNRAGLALSVLGKGLGGPDTTGVHAGRSAARQKKLDAYNKRKMAVTAGGNKMAYDMRLQQIAASEAEAKAKANQEMFRTAIGGNPVASPVASAAIPSGGGGTPIQQYRGNDRPPPMPEGYGAPPPAAAPQGAPDATAEVEPPPADPATPPTPTGNPEVDRIRQLKYAEAMMAARKDPGKAVKIMSDFQKWRFEQDLGQKGLGVKEGKLNLDERKFAHKQNVDGPQHKGTVARSTALAANDVKRYTTIEDNGARAADEEVDVNAFDRLMTGIEEEGGKTGPLSNYQTWGSGTLSQLGIDPRKFGLTGDVSKFEALRAISSRFTLDGMESLKGPATDKDAVLVAGGYPQLTTTIQGNRLILKMKKADVAIKRELAQKYLSHRNKTGDVTGFDHIGVKLQLQRKHGVRGLFNEAKGLIKGKGRSNLGGPAPSMAGQSAPTQAQAPQQAPQQAGMDAQAASRLKRGMSSTPVGGVFDIPGKGNFRRVGPDQWEAVE